MSYIGNPVLYQAFVTDQFSGNGSTTAFTMSVSPANTASVLVSVSGVLQDPTTYAISGTTLTFSGAPPAGTGNISVRYLGIPASGVTTTAYRTVTEFTATSAQTTFSVPSYTVGFINVYRNGVRLGAADFTATSGTTVVLANACATGDLVVTESFYVSSVLNAIAATPGAVVDSYINSMSASKLTGSRSIPASVVPAGSVLQVVQATVGAINAYTTSTAYSDAGMSASITPSSASNKVLAILNAQMSNSVSGNNATGYFALAKGSTILAEGTIRTYDYGGNGVYNSSTGVIHFLDSPASTTSVTYKIQFKLGTGAGVYFGTEVGLNSITLMEIAA